MKSGAELIMDERKRQVEEEGWTAEHDKRHGDGKLSLAACCYAMPVPLFEKVETSSKFLFQDPWPWDIRYDKRHRCRASNRGVRAKPYEYTQGERMDLLVKAGALIAAEIDRINRLREGQGWKDDG